MFKTKSAIALFSLSPIAISVAQAQNDSLSLNGYSGLFNVPNAHVTEYGTGVASYSDMIFYQGEYKHNNNVVGSFGLFPHVEVSGRIAWFNTHKNLYTEGGEPRDLSANIKINIPYIPDNWFDLAIGEQDLGGELNYFDARYLVASKTIGSVRIDLGVGQNDLNDRLDGGFGGIEITPFDWISLIAEYDAQNTNTGFRLSTPASWFPEGFRVDLTVLADTDHERSNGRSFYGLNVKFPLGGGFTGKRPSPVKRAEVASNSVRETSPRKPILWAQSKFRKNPVNTNPPTTDVPIQTTNTTKNTTADSDALFAIRKALVEHGFERVDVGTRRDTLVVAFENNIYNRSELDALGVVLGIVANKGQNFRRATIILRNQGFAVIAIDTNPAQYQAFLNGERSAPLYAYYPNERDYDSVHWRTNSNLQIYPKPRITISPILNSGIATEYGVWDYSFGAAINGAVHLWKGALVSATYTQELDNSEDFDEDSVFRNAKIENDMKDMSIQQAIKLGRYAYNNFTLGWYRYDYEGFQNQTLVHSPSGQHQLSLRFGDYDHKDHIGESRDFQLLSYRYYVPKYDVALNATAGEFWNGDKGYRINSLFRFGDQTVELFYKDVEAPVGDEQVEFIGIAWTLPLTLRKDWDSPYLQVKGHEAWRWGFQTRINNDKNTVAFGVADIATTEWGIERTYLNNDKLSPEYIYQNIYRLRDVLD